MPKFVKHVVTATLGTETTAREFFFLAPPGSYQGIDIETGVSEVGAEDVGRFAPTCKVEEILQSSAAVRRKLRVRATNGKAKYKDVVVSADKAATFDSAVIDNVTNLGKVEAVVEPLRATFY